jgi:hypothetical protein
MAFFGGFGKSNRFSHQKVDKKSQGREAKRRSRPSNQVNLTGIIPEITVRHAPFGGPKVRWFVFFLKHLFSLYNVPGALASYQLAAYVL